MTKVVAVSRVHYGVDYLHAVIKSTEPIAAHHVVLYTPTPTFGNDPGMPCPDSREALLGQATLAGGDRLHWLDIDPSVNTVIDLYPDADLILELDADECLHQNLAIDIVARYEAGELTQRRYRLPMIHHWRCFNYACTDGQWPTRLYLPQVAGGGDAAWYPPDCGYYLHHFGYARRDVDMQYKLACSLHRSEFRVNWWNDIYCQFPERLTDLHPVSLDFWNAEFIEDSRLPAVLINHPYRGLEIIE